MNQTAYEYLLIISGATLVAVILFFLIFNPNPIESSEEIEPSVPVMGLNAQQACSSYKNVDGTQYYYNYLGVDMNLFWVEWGLQRFGSINIVGERTDSEIIDGVKENIFECYYEMLRVCDSDFVCQDYSKRFLVRESELEDWCQGQCYS